MKPKRLNKMAKTLKQNSAFDIPNMDTSTEKKITHLVLSVMVPGKSDHRNDDTASSSVPQEYVKVMASIATNAWRAKTKMVDATTGEVREDMRRIDRHVEAIYRNLAEVGIVIQDHTGDVYDEGQPMKVVASRPLQGLKKKQVGETVLPSIFWNNQLIQNGEIEIATPLTPNLPCNPQALSQ
jgi:hypothetical protein